MGGPELITFITLIINRIIDTRSIPDIIKSGIIHPIHKKGKAAYVAGNYRGITITRILCKVLDIIQKNHQDAAIPADKLDLQFSFTRDRSPSHATVLMSEMLAEAKDSKRPLLIASLDIQKAFDVISHPHLLRI